MLGLGERLRKARKLRQLTQKQLAKAAGIEQPSLSEIETGETKMIEADTLLSLCAALKVRPEWLWTGKEPMTHIEPAQKMPDGLRDVIAAYAHANEEIKDAFVALARNELSKSAKTLRK